MTNFADGYSIPALKGSILQNSVSAEFSPQNFGQISSQTSIDNLGSYGILKPIGS
jgi:hypothetical protein